MRCCQCILDFHLSSASQHKSLGHFIIIAQGTESNGKMVTIWPLYPTELSNCQICSWLLTLSKSGIYAQNGARRAMNQKLNCLGISLRIKKVVDIKWCLIQRIKPACIIFILFLKFKCYWFVLLCRKSVYKNYKIPLTEAECAATCIKVPVSPYF